MGSLERKTEPGSRHDIGKLRWSLLPWDALEEVVRVLEAGAVVYGERNWEKGMSYSRVWDCLMRHAVARFKGVNIDPECGTRTAAHIAVNALFLLAYELRGKEKFDDLNNKEKTA